MKLVLRAKKALKKLLLKIIAKISPNRWKEFNELNYWKSRKISESTLDNSHYKFFYTTHFGLNDSFYAGKFILDIGCGPRGSLEWASMAARRIGLDPLAREYLQLGARDHQMEYLDGRAENIPIENGKCDVVFSFNSLDHVENVARVLSEIKRITCPGGHFLLLVEVNHPPTDCEPHNLGPNDIIGMLRPEFACESVRVYRMAGDGIYSSLRAGAELDIKEWQSAPGYFSAKFVRIPD